MAALTSSPPPLQFNPNKKHSEKERWICIYPAYINSKKTVAEGRRIPKDKSVENPTLQEMREVFVVSNIKVLVEERKSYSRERSKEPMYKGRIRVQLKNDDESLVNPSFPSRDSYLNYLSEMIPKLRKRQAKSTAEQAAQATGKKGKGKHKGRK